MMRRRAIPYVKRVKARGRWYYYFDTSKPGKERWKRLPDPSAPEFGSVYAAMLGHRTRTEGVLTVPGLIDLYKASPKFNGLSDNTRRLYGVYLAIFAKELPTAPAGRIARKDVAALIDKQGGKAGAARMILAIVAALYSWGRSRGHVENRPADDIEIAAGGEHAPWPMALVESALASDDDTIRLAVHLLYFTGQRMGDVCAMRWAQIGDGTVSVTQAKTGKHLVIPMHPRLADALARRTRDLRTILVGKGGKPFKPANLRYLIQKWAVAQGEQIVPHGLRKNTVNALLEAGCTVAQVASITGQSLQIVEHYAKARDQQKLSGQAMDKWGGTDEESSNKGKTDAESR